MNEGRRTQGKRTCEERRERETDENGSEHRRGDAAALRRRGGVDTAQKSGALKWPGQVHTRRER